MEITKSGYCYVTVMIEGVAVSGLIDTRSDSWVYVVNYHPNVQPVERCQPEEDHPNVPSAERCQPEEDHSNVQSVERCQPEKGNHSDDNGQPVKEELQPSEQPPKLVKQNV